MLLFVQQAVYGFVEECLNFLTLALNNYYLTKHWYPAVSVKLYWDGFLKLTTTAHETDDTTGECANTYTIKHTHQMFVFGQFNISVSELKQDGGRQTVCLLTINYPSKTEKNTGVTQSFII